MTRGEDAVKKDSMLRTGLGILGILAGLAMWMVYQAEHLSKREHDWRLGPTRFFQEDFKVQPDGRRGKQ